MRHLMQAVPRRSTCDQRDQPCSEAGRSLGGCSVGLWPPQDALQPLRLLGGQGHLGRYFPCLGHSGRPTGPGDDRLNSNPWPSFGERRKKGSGFKPSDGPGIGEPPKNHALSDPRGRLLAFLLTDGQVADCNADDHLLDRMPATDLLHGDKRYDSLTFAERLKQPVPRPTSHQAATSAGKTASLPTFAGTANSSRECSDDPTTSGASAPL